MVVIISMILLGIVAGYFLRRRKLRYLDNIVMGIIWLLLFLLGVEAGSDERIVRWIASLGMEAFAISLGGVAGSSVLSLILWRFTSKNGCGKGDGR